MGLTTSGAIWFITSVPTVIVIITVPKLGDAFTIITRELALGAIFNI